MTLKNKTMIFKCNQINTVGTNWHHTVVPEIIQKKSLSRMYFFLSMITSIITQLCIYHWGRKVSCKSKLHNADSLQVRACAPKSDHVPDSEQIIAWRIFSQNTQCSGYWLFLVKEGLEIKIWRPSAQPCGWHQHNFWHQRCLVWIENG